MNARIIYFALIITGQMLWVGCEKNMAAYDHPDNGINFTDSLINFSFVYTEPGLTRDTVWVKITTMGFVSDADRPVSLRQEITGGNDAVPGTHYLSLTDNTLASLYYIPAGKTEAEVPVVVFRDESLSTEDYVLKLRVDPNGYFGEGIIIKNYCKITLSDQVTKPANWSYAVDYYLAGEYGREKHRFLIEYTDARWDYDYLRELGMTDDGYDEDMIDWDYIDYLAVVLSNKLADHNADRLANDLDVLKEEDGTIVEFLF